MHCLDGAIVCASMGVHKQTGLCASAPDSANGSYGKRQNLILHSNRASQYISLEIEVKLKIIGHTVNYYDNASMEDFFCNSEKNHCL